MASQQTNWLLKLAGSVSGTNDIAAASAVIDYQTNVALDNGTGANQANQVFSDTRTLTTGSNETLDLNATLLNALGESVTFTKVKVLFIRNKGTTDLTIGGATTNGFISWVGGATQTVLVPAGGVLLLSAPGASGFTCTAGTADQLKIANSAGASCDYDIIIIGVN